EVSKLIDDLLKPRSLLVRWHVHPQDAEEGESAEDVDGLDALLGSDRRQRRWRRRFNGWAGRGHVLLLRAPPRRDAPPPALIAGRNTDQDFPFRILAGLNYTANGFR
ncbi:MAG: hypothetical protein NT090_02025, partial [Acidobacteria bacterium]|nr:hypothetical protein [Acidobacteriota bacterium]